MTIKTKTIKNPREFPYQQYTGKVDRHKFEANIYDDNGGQLIGKIGKEMTICREDATLEDWIDEAMEMSDFYHNLVDFLKEVNYIQNNKD